MFDVIAAIHRDDVCNKWRNAGIFGAGIFVSVYVLAVCRFDSTVYVSLKPARPVMLFQHYGRIFLRGPEYRILEVTMLPARKYNPEYVTDSAGHKRAVILPIEEYQELMEDLDDLAAIAERREDPTISHDKVMEDLKRDSYIPDYRGSRRYFECCPL